MIKAMARLLRAGLLAMTLTYPGRGLERRLPRMAPEVLVAAGLGLIGTVIAHRNPERAYFALLTEGQQRFVPVGFF